MADSSHSTNRQKSRVINGKHTEVILQIYSDRYLVLVTQLGKVGALIQASIPPTAPLLDKVSDPEQPNALSFPEPSPAIEQTPILGRSPSEDLQTLHSLYVAQIATIIWTEEAKLRSDSRRSVVVGLAFAKQAESQQALEREQFESIMTLVYDLVNRR
ncbi:hypothetical protein CPB83DRAFT_801489 [Crepidotus variabilis]|uniref:Proteasome assembly chaperone 3 n=1 Tax=Crepidotus variabilis TaxID=179855 RepID=A0A9P6ETS3_9AGAR|nr:hypothetical protein CPB83DRAFT_801489 [Crepidotus variabilis]